MEKSKTRSNYVWDKIRKLMVYFCAFSILGHVVVEVPFCFICSLITNNREMYSEVLDHPFKPFMVYGCAILMLMAIMVPINDFVREHCKKIMTARIVFYCIAVLAGMCLELTQGFLQNQPVNGVYPLWDFRDLPGNILGQAWIVNDILFGIVIVFAVWHIIPNCEKQLERADKKHANIMAAAVIGLFAFLVLYYYVLFPS